MSVEIAKFPLKLLFFTSLSRNVQSWPHCIEFLDRLAEKFELIVFTASQVPDELSDTEN